MGSAHRLRIRCVSHRSFVSVTHAQVAETQKTEHLLSHKQRRAVVTVTDDGQVAAESVLVSGEDLFRSDINNYDFLLRETDKTTHHGREFTFTTAHEC